MTFYELKIFTGHLYDALDSLSESSPLASLVILPNGPLFKALSEITEAIKNSEPFDIDKIRMLIEEPTKKINYS